MSNSYSELVPVSMKQIAEFITECSQCEIAETVELAQCGKSNCFRITVGQLKNNCLAKVAEITQKHFKNFKFYWNLKKNTVVIYVYSEIAKEA